MTISKQSAFLSNAFPAALIARIFAILFTKKILMGPVDPTCMTGRIHNRRAAHLQHAILLFVMKSGDIW